MFIIFMFIDINLKDLFLKQEVERTGQNKYKLNKINIFFFVLSSLHAKNVLSFNGYIAFRLNFFFKSKYSHAIQYVLTNLLSS